MENETKLLTYLRRTLQPTISVKNARIAIAFGVVGLLAVIAAFNSTEKEEQQYADDMVARPALLQATTCALNWMKCSDVAELSRYWPDPKPSSYRVPPAGELPSTPAVQVKEGVNWFYRANTLRRTQRGFIASFSLNPANTSCNDYGSHFCEHIFWTACDKWFSTADASQTKDKILAELAGPSPILFGLNYIPEQIYNKVCAI